MSNTAERAPRTSFCLFTRGPQRLAIPIERIREVVFGLALERLPRCHPMVLGVRPLRRDVLTVIDAAGLLQIDRPAVPPDARVLVLEAPGGIWGLLVDRVIGIGHFETENRGPQAELAASAVAWWTSHEGQNYAVLDPDRLVQQVRDQIEQWNRDGQWRLGPGFNRGA